MINKLTLLFFLRLAHVSAFPDPPDETQECPVTDGLVRRRLSSSYASKTKAIITNGVIKIGLFDDGALNADKIGLQSKNSGEAWVESTSHGCTCEGWGASAATSSGSFSGYANSAGAHAGLTASPIVTDGTAALIDVTLSGGPLRVTHYYYPAPETANLYVADIIYENTDPTKTLTDLRYRRVMDWDIPPFVFNECVTVDVGTSKDFEFANDNGFSSTDPLTPATLGAFTCISGGSVCPVYDNGPTDHGALLQFLFKNDDLSVALLHLEKNSPSRSFTGLQPTSLRLQKL
jgi:hypothetical protein